MQEHTIPINPTGSDKNKPLIPKNTSADEMIPIAMEAIPKILILCCIDKF